MKKKSKRIKLLLGIILIWGIIFSIDALRTTNKKNPIFVLFTASIQDGGSAEFYCLGYKIIKYVELVDSDNGYNPRVINMKIGTYFMPFDKSNPN